MVVCLFEIYFPTESQNACLIVVIHVCIIAIDLSQLSHTADDRAFSRLVGRFPIDVVRNTARVSTKGCWSGKRHI